MSSRDSRLPSTRVRPNSSIPWSNFSEASAAPLARSHTASFDRRATTAGAAAGWSGELPVLRRRALGAAARPDRRPGSAVPRPMSAASVLWAGDFEGTDRPVDDLAPSTSAGVRRQVHKEEEAEEEEEAAFGGTLLTPREPTYHVPDLRLGSPRRKREKDAGGGAARGRSLSGSDDEAEPEGARGGLTVFAERRMRKTLGHDQPHNLDSHLSLEDRADEIERARAEQGEQLRERNLERMRLDELAFEEEKPRKVYKTSEHLLQQKGDVRWTVRAMSFKMRMEELSQKVATARINPGSMEDRLEEHRLARMGERGANARDYLSTNLRGVDDGRCRVEEKLILMKLRAVSEEVKLAAARLGRKNVIQGFQKHALDTMVSKQQRREEMKTLADRARAQAHYDSIARVLLPAILAAARVSVFARILKRSRYVLSKAKQGTAACIKIQRMFKWRTWRSWFTRGMAMKKFLRKNLWVVWLDFRIRRKGVAVGVLATSVREYSARVPAVALLRKYKYKIRMAQTQIRRTMTAKNGQILSVMRQWSLFLMAQCTPMPDGKKKRRMKKTAVSVLKNLAGGGPKSTASGRTSSSGRTPTNGITSSPLAREGRGGSPAGLLGAKLPQAKKTPAGTFRRTEASKGEHPSGINFALIPDAEEDPWVRKRLGQVVSDRRRMYADELMHWREALAEWKEKPFLAEQARELLGLAPADRDKDEEEAKTVRVAREAERRREVLASIEDQYFRDPLSTKPWLRESAGVLHWSAFQRLKQPDTNPQYRENGPPRPIYRTKLDEASELFPLFVECRERPSLTTPLRTGSDESSTLQLPRKGGGKSGGLKRSKSKKGLLSQESSGVSREGSKDSGGVSREASKDDPRFLTHATSEDGEPMPPLGEDVPSPLSPKALTPPTSKDGQRIARGDGELSPLTADTLTLGEDILAPLVLGGQDGERVPRPPLAMGEDVLSPLVLGGQAQGMPSPLPRTSSSTSGEIKVLKRSGTAISLSASSSSGTAEPPEPSPEPSSHLSPEPSSHLSPEPSSHVDDQVFRAEEGANGSNAGSAAPSRTPTT